MFRTCLAAFFTLALAGAASAQTATEFKGHTALVHNIAVSPDGKELATAGFDDVVKIWEIATGKNKQTLTGHAKPVDCVAYRPDGKVLASSRNDNTIRLWNLADGKTIAEIKAHTDIVSSIAFSPDGKYLASASADKSVRLWNAADGKEAKNLGAHGGSVYSVAFSPDSKYLASAGQDSVVKIWDVAGQKELKTIKAPEVKPPEVKPPEMAVTALVFSPDSKNVIVVGLDRFIKVLVVAGGKEIKKVGPLEDDPFGIAWSRDGKNLATIGYSGAIRVWDEKMDKPIFQHRIMSPAYCITFSADGK